MSKELASSVECEAAIAWRRQAGTLSDSANSTAQERWRRLAMGWFTVDLRIALRDRVRGWFWCIRFEQPTCCNSLRR